MQTTIDHTTIEQWAHKHNGKPAIIDYPQAQGNTLGIRLNFPGNADETLLSDSHPSKNISWDEFFRIFDDEDLSFMYESDPQNTDPTTWYRFAKRNSIEEK